MSSTHPARRFFSVSPVAPQASRPNVGVCMCRNGTVPEATVCASSCFWRFAVAVCKLEYMLCRRLDSHDRGAASKNNVDCATKKKTSRGQLSQKTKSFLDILIGLWRMGTASNGRSMDVQWTPNGRLNGRPMDALLYWHFLL